MFVGTCIYVDNVGIFVFCYGKSCSRKVSNWCSDCSRMHQITCNFLKNPGGEPPDPPTMRVGKPPLPYPPRQTPSAFVDCLRQSLLLGKLKSWHLWKTLIWHSYFHYLHTFGAKKLLIYFPGLRRSLGGYAPLSTIPGPALKT